MLRKNFNNKILFVLCLIFICVQVPVLAQVASSTNYLLMQDSLNMAGDYSSSTNFGLEDTLGEPGTGYVSSTNYLLRAGYQQAADQYFISVSLPASNLALSPAIGGSSGGSASGAVDVGISTNNPIGYSLSIAANPSNPALSCSSGCGAGATYFKDYVPAVSGVPDLAWVSPVDTRSFGFTVDGSHISSYFKDNGSVCNSGSNDSADACWYGLNYSLYSNRLIAYSSSPNSPNYTTTTIKFKTESAAGHSMAAGSYSATVVVTAIVN